jgi:adhesin/invasin
MVTRFSLGCGVVLALVAAACDTVPLTAPTGSALTITAASSFVPTGGTTEVTAFVVEESGTAVQNGTTVRFTTNLGRMDPPEAQTRNGYAVSTFVAGDSSGLADVTATSGGIGSGTGTGTGNGNGNGGTTTTGSNSVRITVGAAAVETVLLAANPGSVPAAGGTVDLLATVVSAAGRSLSGILVTFASSEGQLSSPTAITDANGQARTTLTTTRTASVTASAGAKTSTAVTVTRRDPASVATASVAATPIAAVPGSGGQTVNFVTTVTVNPADASIQATRFEWDFGDGSTATTNGPDTSHVYTTGEMTAKTVTVTVTLTNGQTLVASTQFLLGDF